MAAGTGGKTAQAFRRRCLLAVAEAWACWEEYEAL